MVYKFEELEVWKLALELIEIAYRIIDKMPGSEIYNLSSQLRRSVTSIALNIAEGSTSQTDAEQSRFLGYAIRSNVESIACIRIIETRNYLKDDARYLGDFEHISYKLFGKLQAFKKALS